MAGQARPRSVHSVDRTPCRQLHASYSMECYTHTHLKSKSITAHRSLPRVTSSLPSRKWYLPSRWMLCCKMVLTHTKIAKTTHQA